MTELGTSKRLRSWCLSYELRPTRMPYERPRAAQRFSARAYASDAYATTTRSARSRERAARWSLRGRSEARGLAIHPHAREPGRNPNRRAIPSIATPANPGAHPGGIIADSDLPLSVDRNRSQRNAIATEPPSHLPERGALAAQLHSGAYRHPSTPPTYHTPTKPDMHVARRTRVASRHVASFGPELQNESTDSTLARSFVIRHFVAINVAIYTAPAAAPAVMRWPVQRSTVSRNAVPVMIE